MVHRRDLDGETLVFGNQGALWGNAMTWWDHDTGTVWSQPLGEAVAGPLAGSKLELMASRLTSWAAWKEDRPNTLALDAPAGRSGFDLQRMSVVVDFGEEVGVYRISDLVEAGPANDVVANVPVVIVVDPSDESRWSVFHRVVGDADLTFELQGDSVVDIETRSVWDPGNGRALEGPLAGEILGSLPGFTAFESDARTFWPDASYWEVDP